jgi:hypothetical protein
LVTLDDRDALKVIAKRARREQSRHAAADDNGVVGVYGARFVTFACRDDLPIHEYFLLISPGNASSAPRDAVVLCADSDRSFQWVGSIASQWSDCLSKE